MVIELCFLLLVVSLVLYVSSEFRAYYFIRENIIVCKHSDLHRQVLEKCRQLRSPFAPSPWAANSHLQTWLRSILPQRKLNLAREYLEMKDGGLVSLDWISDFGSSPPLHGYNSKSGYDSSHSILLIIPGIFNINSRDYSDLCFLAMSSGLKPVVLNRRGYSDTPLLTPRVLPYCDASDLEESLAYIDAKFPLCKVACVAFSMEAACLVSYLGQAGSCSRVSAAVCISPTFDCENRSDRFCMKPPYSRVVTEKLKEQCLGHPLLGTVANFLRVRKSKIFADLLTHVHVRVNNYSSYKEYAHYNNSVSYLSQVHTPLLCISSGDDPVVPANGIPVHVFEASDFCVLVQTQYGGHCGFYHGVQANSWANSVAVEFLTTLLDNRVLTCLTLNGSNRMRSMTT